MSWLKFLADARRQAEPFIGAAIKHRRDHPGLYAKANALAADFHRAQAEDNEHDASTTKGRVRRRANRHAWWNRKLAWHHRTWRRWYEHKAESTAEHQECARMMRRHDEPLRGGR